MWVRRGGPPDQTVILFDYDPSRGGKVPVRLLESFRGILQTDGYEGYAAVTRGNDIAWIGCRIRNSAYYRFKLSSNYEFDQNLHPA